MILASIVDITERRRAQERLESALGKDRSAQRNPSPGQNNLQVIASLLNLQPTTPTIPRCEPSSARVRIG